jgi:hypothetical protein
MIAARYAEWIAAYSIRQDGILLGKCREAVADMLAAFPELREVRGHVHCMWGKRGHFWTQDLDGSIVDPTRAQFPGGIEYEPWVEGSEVRVGKCMNCGADIWEQVKDLLHVETNSICGPDCERELEHYYNDDNDDMKREAL